MKWINYFFVLIAMLVCSGMVYQTSGTYSVEGIFYLDHSPVRIEVKDGKISDVVRMKELSDKNNRLFIGPGLIDNQVNGYSGISFVSEGGDLTKEGIHTVTESLWKEGVTTYLPTLRTIDQKTFLRNLALLASVKDDASLHGSIPGFHLEGPYISPVDGFRGAHELRSVKKPDWKEFLQFIEASKGNILQVTVAPEIEGALDFIKKCREKNVVVALGHHNASANQVQEAVDRGALTVTHLGNGMANSINRHDNPLWSQLSDDRLMVSIIGDGFHLRPEEIRVFYKVKGPERMIITSDVTRYAGMKPGKYLNAEGDTIQLTEDGAALYLSRNVLSGAAAPITKGLGNVMRYTGCTMEEAFRMASHNPARLYGLTDRGAIKPGMRADLVLFTMDDFKMKVRKTIVAGEVVYEAKK